MSFPPIHKAKSVDPAIERRLSEMCLLPEIPTFHTFKTPAQLSLTKSLQGGGTTGGSNQAKSTLAPAGKGPDAKPRLLLMGLRR